MRIFHVSQIARHLGVCKNTVRSWDNNGVLRLSRDDAGARFCTDSELRELQRIAAERRLASTRKED